MQVARELGYEGNYYAQRLKKRCEQTIALFSLSVTPDVALQEILTIQQLLGRRGFSVPLHSMAFGDEARHVELMRSLRRQRPRGLVFCVTFAGEDVVEELRRYVEEGGVAVIYGDNSDPIDLPCDQIFFDTDENIYLATRHLLEQGHRRVGLAVHGGVSTEQRNCGAFRRALDEFDAPFVPEWLWGEYPFEAGGVAVAEQFLQLNDRPTAICIVNDNMATAFVNRLARAGVRVPDEVSVIGNDDSLAAQSSVVPLTTVTHYADEHCRLITETLFERLEGKYCGPARTMSLHGELVVRESTGPPKHHDTSRTAAVPRPKEVLSAS
jgi:DNA-binding LacI/PurR family transcriptional regulator